MKAEGASTIRIGEAPLQRHGSRAEWRRLPRDVREIVTGDGMERLRRVRAAISADSGLPMPRICVEPYGWLSPQGWGIFGRALPLRKQSGSFEWGVQLPAASLIVKDDDTSLRRLVCHEFAHCLWWNERIMWEGGVNGVISDAPPPGVDAFEWQAEKDRDELADPEEWFGPWDVANFQYEEIDQASNLLLDERWISRGLPTIQPVLDFNLSGAFDVEDEIADKFESRHSATP